ncbi:MAG: holo-ACP synthase [Alphaproteobacteria bacterium]
MTSNSNAASVRNIVQIGIGIDIVDIRRIEAVLNRFGERFTHRIFTPNERQLAEQRSRVLVPRNSRAATYAKRFAAKEACAKALGTGVPRRGVHWRHIEVVRSPYGAPALALSGGALVRARLLAKNTLGDNAQPSLQISLADDYPYAQAIVTILATLNP